MIEIDEARELVMSRIREPVDETVSLNDSLGRVLREPIVSDVDSPPHDKALMDGFAVIASDFQDGKAELSVLEQITAGAVPQFAVESGSCSRIMTGAPIPEGADAVVMIEHLIETTAAAPHERVSLGEPGIRSGQNIMKRGASLSAGAPLLDPGHRIQPADVGLLAEVGRDQVQVSTRPQVAVLSTGNELVPCGQRPGDGQIRNSNGPMLRALAAREGAIVSDLGIASDEPAHLHASIRAGFHSDVLLLSGGVSAGVLDLVPAALAENDVQSVFHKVNLKPGKPIYFGVRDDGSRKQLVFGLPGNPVSSLVGFLLFVVPALRAMAGDASSAHGVDAPPMTAQLDKMFHQRTTRPTYWPSVVRVEQGIVLVTPLDWKGSADQRTMTLANGLAFFPGEQRDFQVGEIVKVLGWHPQAM